MVSNHFLFLPLPGEMMQFDEYFSNGLKPPTSLIIKSNLFSMIFFQVEIFFCFEGIPYTWLKSIRCQNTNKKYPPAKKKRKPLHPPKTFHMEPQKMGFVSMFFFPFPRGPFFSASIRGVGCNRRNQKTHEFDGWIIQEVDLVEDFHGAVWRLPDGEMAIGLGGSESCIFFFGWPCSNRNVVSN